jgi:hypothetical protein
MSHPACHTRHIHNALGGLKLGIRGVLSVAVRKFIMRIVKMTGVHRLDVFFVVLAYTREGVVMLAVDRFVHLHIGHSILLVLTLILLCV